MLALIEPTILYIFFVFLFLWRGCTPWPKERSWKDSVNYITVLYAILVGLYLVSAGIFLYAWYKDSHTEDTKTTPPTWVRILANISPFCVGVTIALCWAQSRLHLSEIRAGYAVLQHDRALNIIALPAVYSVILMGANLSVYAALTQSGGATDAEIAAVETQYEVFVFVADVYEAWALFQFGTLVSEYFEKFIGHHQIKAPSEHTGEEAPSVGVSVAAMASVMWVGLSLFGVVCICQAGYSLYLWYFKFLPGTDHNLSEYEESMQQFYWAGLVSSAGAIYNVAKFEHTFGEFIRSFSPFLKFMSVKMIVFFAFWQEWVLNDFRILRILPLTEIQVKLLSGSLLSIECWLCCLMHWVAWRPSEGWYSNDDDDERRPLLAEQARTPVDKSPNP